MRVFVTGASGHIGSLVVAQAHSPKAWNWPRGTAANCWGP